MRNNRRDRRRTTPIQWAVIAAAITTVLSSVSGLIVTWRSGSDVQVVKDKVVEVLGVVKPESATVGR